MVIGMAKLSRRYLADLVLDGHLAEIIDDARADGASWDDIARLLSDHLGGYLSAVTVRQWRTEMDSAPPPHQAASVHPLSQPG